MPEQQDYSALIRSNENLAAAILRPKFEGPPEMLVPYMSRLKLIPGEAKDVKGTLDDFSRAIESETPAVNRVNRKNLHVPARWYELGEDGTIINISGDYASPFIRFFNEALSAREKGKIRAEERIDYIKSRHPTDLNTLKTKMTLQGSDMFWNAAKFYHEANDKSAALEFIAPLLEGSYKQYCDIYGSDT